MGALPSQIIFANPTKSIPHINYAKSVGVDTMTFDSEFELYKIKKYFPTAKWVLELKVSHKSELNLINSIFS